MSDMILQRLSFVAMMLAFLGGCSTVEEARKAQDEVAGRADSHPDGRVVEKVNLKGYTLRQLVEYAMTNRPSVVSARLAVEDARLAVKTVAADAPLVSSTPWTAPKLSMGGSYSALSDASSSRLGWHTEGDASASLSLDLLVWDFGRNSARAKAAAEDVIAAERTLLQEGYTVFGEVATAYFTLLESDALLEVARTNEFEYAEHLRQAQDKLAAGEAQRLDVTRARLDLSQARQKTVAASNLVVTSGAELMRVLGIDTDRGTRADVLPPNGNLLRTVRRGFAATDYTVAEAFDLARTNAPTMAIARARLRSSVADVDYAVADLLPNVSVDATLSWSNPLWFWQWGASAAQTIFQGFRKTTAVERAVVAMRQQAAVVDDAEQELSLSLDLAIATRDNAKEARATAAASVRSAKENYDTVKEQYREGDASRIDFTDAIGDYAQALGSCITAFYNGQIAEARLFALTGKMPEYREENENVKEAR